MIKQVDNIKRASNSLLSEQNKVAHIKSTIYTLLTLLVLLIASELILNGFSALTLAMFLSCALLFVFRLWISVDTSSVISAMIMWSIALFITYVCWLGNGIFDTAILAFPGLLILTIVLSDKLMFIAILVYIIATLCFLSWAQYNGLLVTEFVIEGQPLWKQAFSSINFIALFSGGVFILFSTIKKRFKNILEVNTLLELDINQLTKNNCYDLLTQLPNENVCTTDLKKMLQQQKSSGHLLAFITLNIRNLHSIKINYNHSTCDHALQLLAKNLVMISPKKAMIYRFQQNEFIILMHFIDHRGISKFAEKVNHACSQTYYCDDFSINLQPEIGIALAPFDGSNMKTLRHNSHLAMHVKGETGFHFFDQEMAVQEQRKLELTKALKTAIENNELFLHFQPKIDLSTGQIIAAEALLRWRSPVYGFVSPVEFIPLAEQAGIITDITHWVIEHSAFACQQWHESGFNHLSVAVNLSAQDFKRCNLTTHTIRSLHKANLPAHFLELELTESMLMDDINSIQKQINELRALGISFAIDDFGTGYSNLGYLTKFNVSTLKLDRSFVKEINNSSNELQIVKAIIGMSKSLGISNVAEGIEDQETADVLTDLGCEMGQGYLWSAPLLQEDFIALLIEKST